MQRSLELPKLSDNYSFRKTTGLVCNECGGSFQKPILATVSLNGRSETYYACPRCLTKISEEHKVTTIPKKDVKKPSVEPEDDVECPHFFGYLKKRPKDSSIPEECLTCDKMIECLSS